MTKRSKTVKFLFYPEDKYKGYWDLWMTLILLITCLLTPLTIAFTYSEDSVVSIVILAIDGFFIIDILVIFNSAFYDDDTDLIDERKKIARNYLHGWFTIDILAIFPFDVIL